MLLLARPLGQVVRRTATALLVLAPALLLLSGAASVSAAGICVNPHGTGGCYSSINAAIAAAAPGATVNVQSGKYTENVIISKPLTLQGNGNPTIYSAISNPDCGDLSDSGPTLCAPNSTIILVQADNVTIAGFTLDGDNPHLHSGVEVDGADIDARNGIVTDFNTVTTNVQNLTVRDNTVRNVFHRGVQITSNSGFGTFTFRNNTVKNVQGNSNYAVAMLSNGNGNAGTMSGNTVSDASDALNSNWSHGITFSGNTVRNSGVGVHTDNAGGAGGGTADLIVNNTVQNCTPGGYGIWTFVSYIAPTVRGNTITNCDTGLAVLGIIGAAGSVTPVFKNNTVHSNGPNSIGALITTDLTGPQFGFGYYNVSAAFSGNTIRGAATGERVLQDGGMTATATFTGDQVANGNTGLDADGATVTMNNGCATNNHIGLLAHDGATLTATRNAITGNSSYGAQNSNAGGTPAIDASKNWWGSASGPAPAGHGDRISAGVNATPFLTANPQDCGSGGGR